MRRQIFLLGLIIVSVACSERKNRFTDPIQVKIADLQDRRDADSLIAMLATENIEHQRAIALAFGSVQDSMAVDALDSLLNDAEVYSNVAFALGQTPCSASRAVLEHYITHYTGSETIRSEAYEAIGKTAAQPGDAIWFRQEPRSPKEEEGFAWGIYRAGVRGMIDEITLDRGIDILEKEKPSNFAKLGIAHFFSRGSYTSTPAISALLSNTAKSDDAEIRMATISAFAKAKPEEGIVAMTDAISDPDYRVRVNASRALRIQEWEIARPLFEKLLNDSNVHVNVAAAEVIATVAKDTSSIHDWARKATNWRAQATLYETLMKLSPTYSNEIKSLYNQSTNPYQKAALIAALSQGDNAGFILDQFRSNHTKIIKSTASSALARINRTEPQNSRKFVDIYKEILKDGDQGAIIYACGALIDTTLRFKELIDDFSFLEDAKSKLSLPRDFETYEPLERTLNYFKELPPPPPLQNEFNHPIDWKLAVTIDKDQKVVIETTKGKIVMQLFIEEAPGSVVNFVKLVNDKYYDGKFFHRVVPNFVIQTGCDRGDGFGSLDYSIRSEFSRRKYKTGSVGMASAGKDTEGVQWFITHSPTPHLDGKYTIFAEVVEGMEVVHKIEVGDQILSARLGEN